ncbi:MAG: B12-binding domain-containing radical SAM protein [Nanoarchaeota archaeon]|nr:B12-binding domain-containing radical SAM protein [Nanoarchaeota archaeon]
MKIVFIQPNLSTSERYGKALGKVGPTCEPLGLTYLAAAIREKRNDIIKIIDAVAFNYSSFDLKKILTKFKPDVVGVMILTPTYLVAKETIELVRELLPYTKILAGGPHVTIFPKQTMEEVSEVDIVVVGEGEVTIVDLLDSFEKKRHLSEVKGILYRKNKKIISTSLREPIKNIDEIPMPARDLLDMKKYKPAPTYYRRLPSYIMLTSRGCPYNCSYCSKIFGSLYRFNSVERILKEMEVLIYKHGAKEIIFRDDTFTINKKHIVNLCNEIIRKGLNKKIKWTCMTRVNLVSRDLLFLMKKAGCWSIHYGIESGSQRLLNLINKQITLKQSRDAIKWAKEASIETKAFFMLGLPTETIEDSLKTLEFTKELEADWIQVTITVPYPGTNLYEIAKKDGTLKSFKWEDYQTWAGWVNKDLVYVPKGRNGEDLKKLQKKAMRDFYLRPKFVFSQLKNLNLSNFKVYLSGAQALIKSRF